MASRRDSSAGSSSGFRTTTTTDSTTSSSSSDFDDRRRHHGGAGGGGFRRHRCRRPKPPPPPIGVFWDIENCHVPRNRSASSIVRKVREVFFGGYREAEFIVVCDVKKENAQIVQDLHDAQVNLIHVQSTSKNAADEKLRQSLRRFAETHSAPSAVVLISGDVNFAGDLSDLRHRKNIRVILVHNCNAADALIACATDTYPYSSLTENLPLSKAKLTNQYEILIENLPIQYDRKKLQNRLKFLSDNCGGKVVTVDVKNGSAVLRFTNYDYAVRAQRRLRDEDVYGYRITLSDPINVGETSKSVVEKSVQFSTLSPKTVDGGTGQSSGYCSQEGGSNNHHMNKSQNKESFFEPIDDSQGACGITYPNCNSISEDDEKAYHRNSNSELVELTISNLDANMTTQQLKNFLTILISEYAVLVSLEVATRNYSPIAIAKFSAKQEAQLVVDQLHRFKVGNKRIIVQYAKKEGVDLGHLRAMVVTVLQETRGNRLPLVKLIELIDLQYHARVSTSDIEKLKDIVVIKNQKQEGSVVSLALKQDVAESNGANIGSSYYCMVHYPKPIRTIDSEEDLIRLPNVNISLGLFSSRLNTMLTQHTDVLPLLSFPICYKLIFEEHLPENNKTGVPLEHLVTCVSGVKLIVSDTNSAIKYIVRDEAEDNLEMEEQPPPLTPANASIQLLCREFVDLLRTTERCQVLFSKLIPAYFHHYGRQCRVADYGHTKLMNLLQSEPVSKTIQVIGLGERRIVTLTHRAQISRFAADLKKILKTQPMQTAPISMIRRRITPHGYGLCRIEDLLSELPKDAVDLAEETVSLPPKQRTPEEVANTDRFAEEVVRVLKTTPEFAMVFNKFVPAYHHEVGKQCKVSDYGFGKLVELFESIPETVRIEELPYGDRKVCLTANKTLEILGTRIREIVKDKILSLEELGEIYRKEYSHHLRPQDYGFETIGDLVGNLRDYVTLKKTDSGLSVTQIESESNSIIVIRLFALLLNPPNVLLKEVLFDKYSDRFGGAIYQKKLEELSDVVKVDDDLVKLTPFYVLATQLYYLVLRAGGQLPYLYLEKDYQRTYGKSICYEDFGVGGLVDLLVKMNFVFVVRCTRKKINIYLNQQLINFGIPIDNSIRSKSFQSEQTEKPRKRASISSKLNRSRTPPNPLVISSISSIMSPPPNELPLPYKLLQKDGTNDSDLLENSKTNAKDKKVLF